MSRSEAEKLGAAELERLIVDTVRLALDGCECERRRCVHTKILEQIKLGLGTW